MRDCVQGGPCSGLLARRESAEMRDENQANEQRRLRPVGASEVDRVWMSGKVSVIIV